jgi:hypothetical protein
MPDRIPERRWRVRHTKCTMRYTLDIDSPDYEAMITWLRAYAVTMSAQKHSLSMRYGRTSQQARMAQEQLLRLDRVIAKLISARATANPERALQSTETPARNAGDEMRVVYGRPRNDPRDARTGEKRQRRT